MTTWSKTPPTEPGWYWCRTPEGDVILVRHRIGYTPKENDTHYVRSIEFGPAIPSPEAISALEARLAAQEARIEAAKDALRDIAEDSGCAAPVTVTKKNPRSVQYEFGVADGHRVAAAKARAALVWPSP